MAYRSFSTDTWHDPWFEQLSIPAKLLFIYLWTNQSTNPAGLYEASISRIKFESGVDLKKYTDELKAKITWIEEKSLVWVHNFFRYQCANPKFAHSAATLVSKLPEYIAKAWFTHNLTTLKKYGINSQIYGIDTVSISYHTDTDTDTDTDTGTGTKNIISEVNESSPHETPVFELPRAGKFSTFQVEKKTVDEWALLYPGVDIITELRKMKAWLLANPKKKKVNVPAFVVNWLNRAQDNIKPYLGDHNGCKKQRGAAQFGPGSGEYIPGAGRKEYGFDD
ncbi:MAG: hypothetical protein WC455_14635 [Dehalococcoidia bacterium]|jgi:hypothetical protein